MMPSNHPSTTGRQRKRSTAMPLTAVLLVGLLSAGCTATGAPEDELRFGTATRALRAQQFIAADAPTRHADTLPRADGRTMREAVDRQVDSFRKPPATHIINIGVGNGGGGGGG